MCGMLSGDGADFPITGTVTPRKNFANGPWTLFLLGLREYRNSPPRRTCQTASISNSYLDLGLLGGCFAYRIFLEILWRDPSVLNCARSLMLQRGLSKLSLNQR